MAKKDEKTHHLTLVENIDSEEEYYVVKNLEEQYSIWPTYKKIPLGWKAEGSSQAKSKCLEYIKEVWVDMRPLSLRKQMEERQKNKLDLPVQK
jgi:MbtH protein